MLELLVIGIGFIAFRGITTYVRVKRELANRYSRYVHEDYSADNCREVESYEELRERTLRERAEKN